MTKSPVEAAKDLYDLVDRNARAARPTDPVPDATVTALFDAGLHTMLVPREAGGSETPIVECIDAVAEISRADGSAGWCLMANAATIAFFGAWAGDDFAEELFADGVPLAAGQFAPNGVATPDDGGYRITGDYHFGSGVNHSTWIGAGVLTAEDDSRLLMALLPRAEVTMQGGWDVLGLEATASWDYSIRDAWVPEGATFDFFAPVQRRGGAMYQMGVLGLTSAGHAGVAIGVVRRALDELRLIATTKARMGASAPLRDKEGFLLALASLESRARAAACSGARDLRHGRGHRAPHGAGRSVRAGVGAPVNRPRHPGRRVRRARCVPARRHRRLARRPVAALLSRHARRQPALLRGRVRQPRSRQSAARQLLTRSAPSHRAFIVSWHPPPTFAGMKSAKHGVVVISVLALLAAACSTSHGGDSATTSATTDTTTPLPSPAVPAKYADLYDRLQGQLDSVSDDPRLDGDAGVSTTLGIELLAANGNRGEQLLQPSTMESVRVSLDRYQELGATGVTVAAKYPLLASWFPRHEEYAQFYRQVADEVHRRGLKLFVDVSPLFTGTVFSSVTIDPSHLNLTDFTADETAITQQAIELMHPDWLVIIDEPDTAATLTGIGELGQIGPFTQFVNSVVDKVDHGDTELVAGAGTWMPASFLETLASQAHVDVLGLHIYPVSPGIIDTTVAAVDAAHATDKTVLLDEAWLYKANADEAGGPAMASTIFQRDAYSFWQPLDGEFVDLIGRVAKSQGMTYVALFWAGLLFSYLDWTPALDAASYQTVNRQLTQAQAAALVAGVHSPTGERYQAVATEGR